MILEPLYHQHAHFKTQDWMSCDECHHFVQVILIDGHLAVFIRQDCLSLMW